MHMHTCQLNIFAMLHIRGNLSQTALVLLGQNTLSKHVKKIKLTAFVSAPDTERTKSGEKKVFCKHSSVTLILEKKRKKNKPDRVSPVYRAGLGSFSLRPADSELSCRDTT